jgi:hypothetical protein
VLCSEKIFITQDTLYEKTIPRRPTENTVQPSLHLHSHCFTDSPTHRLTASAPLRETILFLSRRSQSIAEKKSPFLFLHNSTKCSTNPPSATLSAPCERPFFSSRGDRGVSLRRKKEESIPAPSLQHEVLNKSPLSDPQRPLREAFFLFLSRRSTGETILPFS